MPDKELDAELAKMGDMNVAAAATSVMPLVNNYLAKLDEIEAAEAKLKVLQAQAREYQHKYIPEAMQAAGISRIANTRGGEIKLGSFTDCSIPKETRDEAHAWLAEHGHGGLVSVVFEVKVPKGESERAQQVADTLDTLGVAYGAEQKVHPQTLKAWARQQVAEAAAEGREFTLPESFNLYHGMVAVVVPPPKR